MKIDIKKKDWILIVLIILVAVLAWAAHLLLKDTAASVVTVKVDGVVEGTYDLSEDRKVTINGGTNILKINNGKADMVEANCPDKLCVKQKPVSANHESLICLPNKVIVEVQSKKESAIY